MELSGGEGGERGGEGDRKATVALLFQDNFTLLVGKQNSIKSRVKTSTREEASAL